MADSLESLELRDSYNSSESDVIADFYVPCLDASDFYDRAAGYFRSSLYYLVGVALSDFALRGGQMRLVCSPALEEADVQAITDAEQQRSQLSESLRLDIERMLQVPENQPVVELLATLVVYEALNVRVAYKPGLSGIFHDKLGVFRCTNEVALSFRGSTNETFMAWDPRGNHEGFDVFRSWEPRDAQRLRRHRDYFDSLWHDEIPELKVVSLPDLPREELERHANRDGIDRAIERCREHLHRVGRSRRARRKTLQPHQTDVVAGWRKHQRGIIDHVTGAGKTVSAIEIIRGWLTNVGGVALVLVPSDLLVKQWRTEINEELGDLDVRLLIAGGSVATPSWQERLRSFTTPGARFGYRVVLATMQTASGDVFLDRVRAGEQLLVVADEVHRIGSGKHRRLLQLAAGGRLGLSATPQRFGDIEGTRAIFDYFGNVLPPPFTIPDAQAAGRLVPYDYYPDVVDLDEDEAERFRKLSQRIAAMSAAAATWGDNDALRGLLLARARIVKKAAAKVPYAVSLVQRQLRAGDRWLVYCEDSEQLAEIRSGLQLLGVDSLEYHSAMVGGRSETLEMFENYGGVLVSIRCLDEGVDIPAVDKALILASSTNQRQYIQRRGRVLRTCPGKYSADIFDCLVAIRSKAGDQQVLKSDLRRARTFAAHARNDSCRYELDSLASTAIADVEFEDEQAEEPETSEW